MPLKHLIFEAIVWWYC